MAFPTIPTAAGGRILWTNQAGTSGTRTFPNLSSLTKNANDLLLAVIFTYQSSTTPQFSAWGGGFTELPTGGDQGSTLGGIGIAYKVSTGSETGTFTVTQAATVTGAATMLLMSIPLASTVTAPEAGTIATGLGPNPGSLDPAGWGTEDTLWIALDGNGMTSASGTWTGTGAGTLTNYSGASRSATVDGGVIGTVEGVVTFRQANAASEDRAAISTHDSSNARGFGLTVAVRPRENHDSGASAQATGGGVYTNADTPGRQSAPTATGGGVYTNAYSRAGGDAENHESDATAAVTGGGVYTNAATPGRQSAPAATGGGVYTPASSTQRAAAPSATGGGVYTPAASKQGAASPTATGGGVYTNAGQKGASFTPSATGGGVYTNADTTQRAGTFAVTGGGVYTNNYTSDNVERHESDATAAVTGGGVYTNDYAVALAPVIEPEAPAVGSSRRGRQKQAEFEDYTAADYNRDVTEVLVNLLGSRA